MKEKFFVYIIKISDIIFLPFVFISGIYFKLIRRYGITMFVNRMPLTKKLLLFIGVFPISNHYYDPIFNYKNSNFNKKRKLPGINFNTEGQLEFLNKFNYQDELKLFPLEKTQNLEFYYNNSSYPIGDSQYLYSIIRYLKPKKIIEIGSGNSTLMAINAINKNKIDDSGYSCEHICIEPYEMKWLENTNVKVIRDTLENQNLDLFKSLGPNDILFIDSTHIINYESDVLKEYLEILPILNKGVYIHIHDIFTPYGYNESWFKDGVSFWNEQYLLEAFLSNNESFEIVGMLNYLCNDYFYNIKERLPMLEELQSSGSFWMKKIN